MRRFASTRRATRFAFDEMPEDAVAELLTFLRSKLNEADFSEACRLGGLDAGITMDNGGPEPFAGMPRPGRELGLDARRGLSLAERFPHAARIVVTP
jgi:hypothetical protein